jgi:hypothetical protein
MQARRELGVFNIGVRRRSLLRLGQILWRNLRLRRALQDVEQLLGLS